MIHGIQQSHEREPSRDGKIWKFIYALPKVINGICLKEYSLSLPMKSDLINLESSVDQIFFFRFPNQFVFSSLFYAGNLKNMFELYTTSPSICFRWITIDRYIQHFQHIKNTFVSFFILFSLSLYLAIRHVYHIKI